jgi:hypothetical protein
MITSRRMSWAKHVALMGKKCNKRTYKVMVGKPEAKRSLRESLHGWEDNIEMCINELWWEGVKWIHLAQ